MQLRELISETRADQIGLEALASKINQYLLQGGQNSTVGKITGTTGPLAAIRISRRVRMPKTQGLSVNATAAYDPDTRTILVPKETRQLESEIVHELRHALDDIKSSGKFLQGRKTTSPRFSTSANSVYLSTPVEINARFTQAIHSIVKDLQGTSPSRAEIIQAIKVEFIVQNITPFFPKKMADPDYRRLFTRALSYLESRL